MTFFRRVLSSFHLNRRGVLLRTIIGILCSHFEDEGTTIQFDYAHPDPRSLTDDWNFNRGVSLLHYFC